MKRGSAPAKSPIASGPEGPVSSIGPAGGGGVTKDLGYRLAALLPLLLMMTGCQPEEPAPTTFTRLPPDRTGITFTNRTGESDSFNILTHEYIYNGGGVGVGDFDADGLPDLFFTGCDTPNELYLNRGDFHFDNISEAAGIGGGERWNNGVTVVDVNNDGWQDVYVCATTRQGPADRANQLFLHQGLDERGVPTFKDVAPDYGIADTAHNTQAAWLDFDGDGDMDLFLLVNQMVDNKRPNDFSRQVSDGSGIRTDKFYRQDRSESGDIVFTEVGPEVGIRYQGFGLAVTVCDLNRDGWPDLYVSNDYLSNDLAYLNTERDGARYFEEVSHQITKHTSYSAMGNDVADLNNDGLPDIIAVDMLPADNLRRKMMLADNNYNYLLNLERFGYHPQFTRNTLQLSRGRRRDSLATLPYYGEVAMQSGLPATDWSWTPLVADFDLDGQKDVIITNGFPRDITDKDFGDYNLANGRFFAPRKLLPKIPSVKLPNVAFRATRIDDGVPLFQDVSQDWGIDVTSFSNGAAYADLDGDGDLDYVVNNIDDPAHLYRNHARTTTDDTVGVLRLRFAEGLTSAETYGAEVEVRQGDRRQFYYLHPHRGYLSSSELTPPVAVSHNEEISLRVRWPGGAYRAYGPFPAEPTYELSPAAGTPIAGSDVPRTASNPGDALLRPLPSPDFRHKELDYADFNVQPMLLHKLSQQGPGVAVAELNGDEYDDLYVSGSYNQPGRFLYGTATGFEPAPTLIDDPDPAPEELGVLFFDADGDGDEDLYVVSGSYEFDLEHGDYADRLYENEGGRFTRVPGGLENEQARSGSVVRASDYDGDGDLDLFVGTRVKPHAYPTATTSVFYRNESSAGGIRFERDEQRTTQLAAVTNVSDAVFSDYDNDGDADLLVTGDWSPVRVFVNSEVGFTEATDRAGLSSASGWWTSISPGDMDGDGDMDYLIGNLGENNIFQPTPERPVEAIYTDMDKNGGPDFIPFAYFKDSTGEYRSYPFFGRGDFTKQVTKIKGIHTTHRSYAVAGMGTYVSGIADHERFKVTTASSVALENTGEGSFKIHRLPAGVQSSPLFGAQLLDLNSDGLLDIVAVGNSAGSETSQGYMDAGNGVVALNKGGFQFTTVPGEATGWDVPGEGRALVIAATAGGLRLVAAQNSGPLVVAELPRSTFEQRTTGRTMREIYWGAGYLSQSSRLQR